MSDEIPHVPDCICQPHVDEFVCAACERVVGWCKGGEGDEDICDDCWAKRHQQPEEQPANEPETDSAA